jgi:Ribbon-helix-helix protein, copG family
MTKTTVYLPEGLKRALAKVAKRRGMSEAELLREAVARVTSDVDTPAPTLPLCRSTGPSIAGDIDRALDGFGSR